MKGLIIGGGSIGVRHLKNLAMLGVEQLALVEPDQLKRAEIADSSNVLGFDMLEAGLDWGPDFVVIATPTHLHMKPALTAARRGVNLFVEKPLSHNCDHLGELAALVAERELISLVGCNMRFHPGPIIVKQFLADGRLGKVLFARIQVGSYLPEWRAQQDYRTNYAAKIETGGGCILDCIHEIDLACWYLGKITRVFCNAAHSSSLEIETEDVASLICQHTEGITSEIHLDYVQRSYQRDCQIVGELGSIFWDFNEGCVRWYDAGKKHRSTHTQPEQWNVNDMYVDEMKHFLDCIVNKRDPVLSIPHAVDLMNIVCAAKLSAKTGEFVPAESCA